MGGISLVWENDARLDACNCARVSVRVTRKGEIEKWQTKADMERRTARSVVRNKAGEDATKQTHAGTPQLKTKNDLCVSSC